jgi:nucleoside-diphosphate-sugar epimerase
LLIKFNSTKISCFFRKFLENKRLNNLGFKPEISLKNGLIKTYYDYIKI